MRIALPSLLIVLFAAGCARYEYDLISPADLTRHIATKAETSVTLEPLEYRMQSYENRLVLKIFNPTDDAMQLAGERSSVVDPDGQSHPLQGGPIAPHSYLKLILPPLRPRVYDPSPTIGFGVGVGVGRRDDDPSLDGALDGPLRDGGSTEPRYLYVYDDNNPLYWDWKGEGEARLTLVYVMGNGKTITHAMTFKRQKM